jgi:hypothetical protein
MQSSPASCSLLPLRSKYSQHPLLKHSQSILELCHIFKGFISSRWIVILSCILVTRRNYIFNLNSASQLLTLLPLPTD